MFVRKKLSAALVLLVAVATAALVAGCGGSSGGGGGEPATLAPKDAPVFVEANLSPDGEEAKNLNELVNTVVGIEDIGKFIAEEFEQSVLDEGQKFDYEKEVEPWLGQKMGLYLEEYDGDNFTDGGIALETSDPGEAEDFIKTRSEEDEKQDGGEKVEEGEFEGNKYWVSNEDASILGVIGDFIVYAEDKASFEEMVTASEGENLAEAEKYEEAIDGAGEVGVASVYVDIGGLIEKANGRIPPETEALFELTGIEPQKATAVASMTPKSGAIELDLSTNISKTNVQAGDASALLESLPASATLGFASPEFGKALGDELDQLNKEGIPGQIEPGELKPGLEQSGIDLESIASSFGDIGGFVEGSGPTDIGGAAVIETKNANEAKNTVSNIGLLLRASRTPGVTALSGELSGFSVRSSQLGDQPLVVGAAGEKIVIAYGPKAAAQALRSQAKTLGQTPEYEAAKAALGSTPMGLFINGGQALDLVKSMLSPEDQAEFSQAEPYVEKISYIGSGQESDGKVTTAKVVIGLEK
jgi:hypothetical protein